LTSEYLTKEDIAKWSDHLRPIQIAEFTGPTTVMENNKRELDFFNILFPEALLEQFVFEPVHVLGRGW
jgi:hypothetical protein